MRKGVTLLFALACLATGRLHAQSPDPAGPGRTELLRAEFLRVIGRPAMPIERSLGAVTSESGRTTELVSVTFGPGERVPLLIVKRAELSDHQPAVIVLHGTNGSKEQMRPQLEALADRGLIGVAMDAAYHGERAAPIPGLANPYQAAMLRAYRTGEGHPYLYDTAWEVTRLVDYLSTRPDIDAGRIGLMGVSKGGTEAYLAAAADQRIAVVAPLIGVQSYGWSLRHGAAWEARTWTLRDSVEAAAADSRETVNATFMKKFYDRIAPGLVDRFDGPAMLPLIVPRPMMIVNGDSDPRSPAGGVREAFAAAEKAYKEAGVPDRLVATLQIDTAHEVAREAYASVFDWFVRWLKPTAR
jgi:dienelactone hydrolase